jgi:HAD superfamily hydrolase (TIGR01509 family)
MHSIDTILFDWDGTLVDSAVLAFEATQKSLAAMGFPLAYEQYEKAYSPDWYRVYEAVQLPQEKWDEANDRWLLHYGESVAELVQGGMRTLAELNRRNYCLGVVTGGSRMRVLREIEAHDLSAMFRTVVCVEDVVNRKPHPEGLNLAMRRIGRQAEACCYVGDSLHDIEMGKRARVQTIGVRSRYPDSGELPKARPDLYFETITQLLGQFAPLPKNGCA